jgi:hypothetical protein
MSCSCNCSSFRHRMISFLIDLGSISLWDIGCFACYLGGELWVRILCPSAVQYSGPLSGVEG